MADTTVPPSSNRFHFARALEVILQPQRTFGLIAEEVRPSWLTPMSILSITAALAVIVRGYLNARAALMGVMQLPQNWDYWSADMQANYMQAQQSMQGPVFSYVIPLVMALLGLWVGWLLLSGLLHLGSTLLGGRGSMPGALNVVAWASLPFAARDLLRVLFMLIARHSITSAGLSGFAGASVFLAQLLSQVDLFYIWYGILLVIGFAASEALSRNKVIAGVAGVLLILLLIQAGLGTATSSISGLAFQRPF
jgi:hypothetical protein